MKNIAIILFPMIIQATILFSESDQKTIEIIAHEIHAIAPQCKTNSIAAMKNQRLQFLQKHKNATAKDLFKALTMKIEGHDILTLLRSYDGDVCQECADIIAGDYELANDVVNWWGGDITGEITLARAMQLGVLK